MLTLLLLRHAKAEPGTFGMADIDRPLAPRGRSDAPRMGAWLVEHGLIPDAIVCSTSRRTRETLELAAPAFTSEIATSFEPAIYEATATRLLTVVRRTPPKVRRLLMVGHNPGFEDLANDLIATAEKTAAERMAKKYGTSGLAVLTWPKGTIEAWAKLTPRSAHLQDFTAPRYLD